MNQTLSNHVIGASDTGEFHYRYRVYTPTTPAEALVVYLPHFGGTIDDWENSLLPERLASSGIASLVGLPLSSGSACRAGRCCAATPIPTERGSPAMGYDPVRKRIVLYGGFDSNGSDFDDTWEWNGQEWNCLVNCK